jgi:hypothetical protein
MKISSRAILLILLTSHSLNTHSQSFYKKCSVASAGYGAPNLITITCRILYKIADHSNYSFSAMGPATLRYEYAIANRVGVGIGLAYTTVRVGYTFEDWNLARTQKVPYTANIAWQSTSVGARLNYHFANRDKFDPYIGLAAGYTSNHFVYSDDSPFPDSYKTPGLGSLYLQIGLGFRYYFAGPLGMYAEIGWDKSALAQAGLTARF